MRNSQKSILNRAARLISNLASKHDKLQQCSVPKNGHGEPTAKEESESGFNQEFKSSTLAPGPSQEELKQTEKKSKAVVEQAAIKAEAARARNSWGMVAGMQVRVLDYRGEQDVWATSAKPDGKLAQVKLKDGQFAIVAEEWGGAEQLK